MIRLNDIVVKFGDFTALHSINVHVKEGEFFTFLGPSGCGKTTTLRTITGFIEPAEGSVVVKGRDITRVPIEDRNIGIVFQSYALFPTMTVYDNIAFGLKVKKAKKDEIDRKVREIARKVDLSDEQLKKAVSQLSGGQQQRVALARALVIEPSVLLFDEPLSNLDAKLRVSMRTEIRRIQQEVGITAIYVTHDQSEAMALSDQIIIMNKGVVAQIGTPQEIYYHPVSEFVADFIGEANFLRGKMTGTENGLAVLDVEGERLAVAPREGMRVGEEYTVVLRPESAALSDEGGLPCTVELSCFMGSYQNYHVRVGNTLVKLAENDPRNKRIYRVGEQCHLTFAPDTVHVL